MVYMYHSFLIHSSPDGHLGCFHVLAIINSSVMDLGVHVSLSDLVSLVCMPRSGIAGSYTVGGNANQYSRYGEQCGDFLKNWKQKCHIIYLFENMPVISSCLEDTVQHQFFYFLLSPSRFYFLSSKSLPKPKKQIFFLTKYFWNNNSTLSKYQNTNH